MEKEIILKDLAEMEERAKKNALSYSDKEYIQNAFYRVFRRAIQKTCNNAFQDAYIQLNIYLNKNEIMTKSNYVLVAGFILQSPTDPIVHNNNTLTDEVAERYLAENPNLINSFESFPEDWQKRVKKVAAESKKEKAELEEIKTKTTEEVTTLQTEVDALTVQKTELETQKNILTEEVTTLQTEVDALTVQKTELETQKASKK